jgi:hypothetical protein
MADDSTTWSAFKEHVAYMGAKDNFLTNVPFFVLLGRIFPISRTTLFIEPSIFAAINFILFYIAGLYFLKRCSINISYYSLMPFVWLSSFGSGFDQLFLNTDWRDFEADVSFIVFMLAAKIYFDNIRPRLLSPLYAIARQYVIVKCANYQQAAGGSWHLPE